MSKAKKNSKSKKATKQGQGKFPRIFIRPTVYDVAAVEVLMERDRCSKTICYRTGLHNYIEFRGLRDQVEKRAHLLNSVGA